MKNRKMLYILIPLVAGIWGAILWKVLDYQPSGEDSNPYTLNATKEAMADTISYELKFNYNDPFLRSSGRIASVGSSKDKVRANNIKQVEIANSTSVIQPSNLIYRGEISGHRYKLGLLEMEGNKVLVRERSVVGEYTILSVETDSLTLLYCDKRFTYGKQ